MCGRFTLSANPADVVDALGIAEAVSEWLDLATSADRLQELLAPAPDDLLEALAASRLVNSPKNDGPECIEPATE